MSQPTFFDGATFDPDRDGERLSRQLDRVRTLMADAQWRTLKEIAHVCDGSEAAVSARLRDLRKARFGGHTVERSYVGDGLWTYRLLLKPARGGDGCVVTDSRDAAAG